MGTSSHVDVETSGVITIHVIPELKAARSSDIGLYDVTLEPGLVTFSAWGAGLEVDVLAFNNNVLSIENHRHFSKNRTKGTKQ
ncbi:hypothetical protein DPMN_120792 [Dreissena polymorpha]|uniref:Uncharacterized protein n=1 Tax=Dreissena polymorpha TaxID=45954 RepID=A0A9D4GS97_DREPO|nr:hypothetical protein DPMN_120792 [Dreissena polymorpha]